MNKFIIIIPAIFVILCIGCEFDNVLSPSKKASEKSDMETLQNEVKRLGTELQILKEEMDRFTQEQQDTLAEVKAAAAKMDAAADSLKTDIDTKLTAIDNKRIKSVNELDAKINNVVKEVTAVLGRIKNTGSTRGGNAEGTEKGFYHTVAVGENPWSIAQQYKVEYGVTAQDILDVNGLKSGDSIRPGQKLFIPVKK